jgi:glycosyltransferase involved in cell wall biosynthesis
MSGVGDAKPRIGLNAHLLNLTGTYRSAGINWYIYHLLLSLSAIPDFDYDIFLGDPAATEHFQKVAIRRSRWPTQNPIVRIAWEQLVQPFALLQHRIELLHAMAFAGPVASRIPWVVTVYDLSFVRYPNSFNTANRLYLNWAVRRSVRLADRIIAISENTRRDLILHYGARPRSVEVVYCGADPSFQPAAGSQNLERLRAERQLPDKMILFVGTIEPRKNIPGLVRAFAEAKRSASLPHHLVLVGARGWKTAEVDAAVEACGVRDSVVFAGYVPSSELPLWYQAASLFVYPSRYEGFGLSPLEAMACGTPVITSNAASLPEVVGDAAILVPPDDESALAGALVRALTDGALREQMTARGLAQAAKFSWTLAARQTADIYQTVLKEHSSSHSSGQTAERGN